MNPYYQQPMMHMDPNMLEMQANYLKYLASFYAQNEQPAFYPPSYPSYGMPPDMGRPPVPNYYSTPMSDASFRSPHAVPMRETFAFQEDRISNVPSTERAEEPPVVKTEPAEPVVPKQVVEPPSEEQVVLQFSPPRDKPIVPKKSNVLDEIPISGAGKSFEQLLEEEMRKNSNQPAPTNAKPKKDFLRRNSRQVGPRTAAPRKAEPSRFNESAEAERPASPKQAFKDTSRDFDAKEVTFKPKEDRVRNNTPKAKDPPLKEDTPKEEVQKPKRPFLRRGEGQLCMNRPPSTPKVEPVPKKKVKKAVQPGNLQSELERFHTESAAVERLQQQLEDKKKKMEQAANDFVAVKERELDDFERWKDLQSEKLKQDNKSFQKKVASRSPNEEIGRLRDSIDKIEAEHVKKELERKTAAERLKDSIAELEAKTRQKRTEGSREVEPPQVSEPVVRVRSRDFESGQNAAAVPRVREAEHSRNNESILQPRNRSQESDDQIRSETVGEDGKIQRIYEDGRREIIFPNGVKKEIHADREVVVYFANQDIKRTLPTGKVIYFFAETQTTQVTFPDGLQFFQFANGQIEKHYSDGTKEISFPDGTVKCIFSDGEEESIFPDGTVQRVDGNGVKYIDFVNGQKDTIFPDGTKIREFPGGRIRKIMPDGRVIDN